MGIGSVVAGKNVVPIHVGEQSNVIESLGAAFHDDMPSMGQQVRQQTVMSGIDIDIFHIPARQKETLCEHVCGTQVPFMNHVRSVHQCEGH